MGRGNSDFGAGCSGYGEGKRRLGVGIVKSKECCLPDLAMFRKGNPVERRLKKICKQEAASLKLLEKQEAELVKAVEENSRLVAARLARETPAEARLRGEIEKITRRLASLNSDIEKVSVQQFNVYQDDLVY